MGARAHGCAGAPAGLLVPARAWKRQAVVLLTPLPARERSPAERRRSGRVKVERAGQWWHGLPARVFHGQDGRATEQEEAVVDRWIGKPDCVQGGRQWRALSFGRTGKQDPVHKEDAYEVKPPHLSFARLYATVEKSARGRGKENRNWNENECRRRTDVSFWKRII